MKRTLLSNMFGVLFILASAIVWYVAREIYATPFLWATLDPGWMKLAGSLAGTICALIVSASLLVLLRPSAEYALVVFVIGGVLAFAFLPLSLYTAAAALLFVISFHFFEKTTQEAFHSFVKVDFRGTYNKSIPTLVSVLALILGIGHFSSSQASIGTFRYSVPEAWVTTGADLVASKSTPTADTQISDVQIREELSKYDTEGNDKRLELMRNLVVEKLKAELEEKSIAAQKAARDQIREATRKEIERQMNAIVDAYRPLLPLVSAFVLFSSINLLSLPIIFGSILIVITIIEIMKKLKIISIVKIKQEVERLAL